MGTNPEQKPVRVLIVDDQAPFRVAARAVVALTDGFEVVGEAATGEAAVDAARALAPDLVLMDLRLPGIDGQEASRRILGQAGGAGATQGSRGTNAGAGDPGARAPVVLLLSTDDTADGVLRAAACGAAAYLPKAEFGPRSLAAAWTAARAVGTPSP